MNNCFEEFYDKKAQVYELRTTEVKTLLLMPIQYQLSDKYRFLESSMAISNTEFIDTSLIKEFEMLTKKRSCNLC